ncbi:MAG: Rrf2 family transcriptional regulator [Fimbriimonadaceae bacterium]
MKFSAQEEYGLRCLLVIARTPEGMTVTIPEIAAAEQLSEPHVAKLLMILRRAGFTKSHRGHTGGYMLSRPASEIIVGDVLAALGGRLYEAGFCERHSGLVTQCVHKGKCTVRFVWDDIQAAVDGIVSQMTLADLISRADRELGVPATNPEMLGRVPKCSGWTPLATK